MMGGHMWICSFGGLFLLFLFFWKHGYKVHFVIVYLPHTAWSASVRVIWKTLTVRVLTANSSLLFFGSSSSFTSISCLSLARLGLFSLQKKKIFVVSNTPEWNLWCQGQKAVTQCYSIWTIGLSLQKQYQSRLSVFSFNTVSLDSTT